MTNNNRKAKPFKPPTRKKLARVRKEIRRKSPDKFDSVVRRGKRVFRLANVQKTSTKANTKTTIQNLKNRSKVVSGKAKTVVTVKSPVTKVSPDGNLKGKVAFYEETQKFESKKRAETFVKRHYPSQARKRKHIK